ncbi:hypothetical protein GCM10029992_62360 [Glycomyces albus]
MFLARARPRLWPVTAAFAVVFGGLVPSTSVMGLIGYLAAFVLPAALVVVPVLLARGRALKLAVAAGMAVLVAALATAGPLAPRCSARSWAISARAWRTWGCVRWRNSGRRSAGRAGDC